MSSVAVLILQVFIVMVLPIDLSSSQFHQQTQQQNFTCNFTPSIQSFEQTTEQSILKPTNGTDKPISQDLSQMNVSALRKRIRREANSNYNQDSDQLKASAPVKRKRGRPTKYPKTEKPVRTGSRRKPRQVTTVLSNSESAEYDKYSDVPVNIITGFQQKVAQVEKAILSTPQGPLIRSVANSKAAKIEASADLEQTLTSAEVKLRQDELTRHCKRFVQILSGHKIKHQNNLSANQEKVADDKVNYDQLITRK